MSIGTLRNSSNSWKIIWRKINRVSKQSTFDVQFWPDWWTNHADISGMTYTWCGPSDQWSWLEMHFPYLHVPVTGIMHLNLLGGRSIVSYCFRLWLITSSKCLDVLILVLGHICAMGFPWSGRPLSLWCDMSLFGAAQIAAENGILTAFICKHRNLSPTTPLWICMSAEEEAWISSSAFLHKQAPNRF